MKIKRGTYTEWQDVTLKVYSKRYESPILESDKEVLLYHEETHSPLEGFVKSEFEDAYWRAVPLASLSNAYDVTTFGIYEGEEVVVETYLGPETYSANSPMVIIFSYKHTLDASLGFRKDERFYRKIIYMEHLSRLWELRKRSSEYNLPLPIGLEEIKEIPIGNNLQGQTLTEDALIEYIKKLQETVQNRRPL